MSEIIEYDHLKVLRNIPVNSIEWLLINYNRTHFRKSSVYIIKNAIRYLRSLDFVIIFYALSIVSYRHVYCYMCIHYITECSEFTTMN